MAGTLNPAEKSDFENFLAENPFEKEAIEGLQMLHSTELEQDLKSLKNRIREKTDKKAFSFRAVAASIAVLVGGVALAIYFTKTPEINSDNLSLKSPLKSETATNQESDKEQAGFAEEKALQDNEKEAETKKEAILLKKERNQSPKVIELEPETSHYDDKQAEISIDKESKKDEDVRKFANEDKLIERKEKQQQAEMLPRQDKYPENAQSGGVVQVEKDQNLPTTAQNKENERAKTQKYISVPLKENRALNKNYDYENSLIFLEGQILDKQSKQGLKSVKVSLKELAKSTFSDSLGRFYLNVPTSDKYQLILELPEYQTMETQAQPEKKNIFYLKKLR